MLYTAYDIFYSTDTNIQKYNSFVTATEIWMSNGGGGQNALECCHLLLPVGYCLHNFFTNALSLKIIGEVSTPISPPVSATFL